MTDLPVENTNSNLPKVVKVKIDLSTEASSTTSRTLLQKYWPEIQFRHGFILLVQKKRYLWAIAAGQTAGNHGDGLILI